MLSWPNLARKWWPAGALVGLFLILAALPSPSAGPPNNYADNGQSVDYAYYNDNSVFTGIGFWIEDHNAAITAVATAFLTIVTALLAWVAYDQGRTSRAQLRAYIFHEVKGFKKIQPH